jgi:hypothetical protein
MVLQTNRHKSYPQQEIGWPYQQYGMVLGNHTNPVWYGDTECAICYGSQQPYQACMVPIDHINDTGCLWETILIVCGTQWLYQQYGMVVGNHTPVWCRDTICAICYGSWKPYKACMVSSDHINNTGWLWEIILTCMVPSNHRNNVGQLWETILIL